MQHNNGPLPPDVITDRDIALDVQPETPEPEPTPPEQWPKLHPAAMHGLVGDAVRLACDHSEADPAAVLSQFLARFGASVGAEPHIRIGDATHYLRLFVAVIGETSKARKGTAEKPVDRLFLAAEKITLPVEPLPVYRGGVGSGEGIVYAVRDESDKVDKDGVPIDPGVDDKRLMVIDEELAGTLRAAAREGSTASAILRQAWDKGDIGTLTKNSPTKATGAHIVFVGHITLYELMDVLAKREIHNGLANRFLWVGARRPRIIAWPKPMPEQGVQDLARRLREAIQFGKKAGELTPTKDAMALWEKVYHRLATDDDPGPVGAVTARSEAQIIRLATHYALLDRSKQIDLPHLTAAVAFWQYCAKTAAYVFGGEAGNNTEAEILLGLAEGPANLSAINDLFRGHTPARVYRQALQRLETAGKVERFQGARTNGGKAPTFYRLTESAENADLRKSTP